MSHKVFIDGQAGTTGLRIRERLGPRTDIELVSVPFEMRKDITARVAACEAADVAILCLPDKASIELAESVSGRDVRLIDASTAHRVADGWVFGFPELSAAHREKIASSDRVSNPGCYATGAISLIAPLVQAGLIAPSAPLGLHAVSGYSGGGTSMIAEFENHNADGYFLYATDQQHKHIPEIVAYGGLSRRPVFVPSVGDFAQGMIVQLPLPFLDPAEGANVEGILRDFYAGSPFVSVVTAERYGPRVDPRKLNGTNHMELSTHGRSEDGTLVLLALLDNLGKGAAGAAVQNLNIMLGLDETEGL